MRASLFSRFESLPLIGGLRLPARMTAKVRGKRGAADKGSESPAKILIHAINYAPELIGCGKYTTELAQYLRARGCKIEIVTAPPHYPGWYVRKPYRAFAYLSETLDGIKVTRCPMLMKANGGGLWRLLAPLSFALAAAPMVAWRIVRFRPDVVMCVEPTLFSAPVAMIAAKLVGARTLLHVQDLEVDAAFGVGHIKGEPIKQAGFFLERLLMGQFDRVVTISQKMRAALLAKGLDPVKVEVLRNWVDTGAITPTPKVGNAFRAELNINDDAFVALYAGHLGVKQALDVVIAAARRLRGRGDIRFVIAGAGPLSEALQAASADLPNVLHLPLQPAERLNELLGMADIHLLPQHRGVVDLVMPSKLGGMLASGRPLVVAADPGSELFDVLTDIALLTPAGDDAALAAAIEQAVTRDLSDQVKNGLRLADSLSSSRLLPRFERVLLEHIRQPETLPAANEAEAAEIA
jgi:colanic acid biosynthesis glycosyl transferase WcaI